ncbi:MAG: FAD binding domain-containing protein [Rhodobacteraceae bacterium]|jgi:carbon-monoxide dehydrogenase medium subunit/xanthine dehydrogenase FAD-binding subunit|nr:FAD binding domain-containing protein [Paracoccaceae bacterium]
MLSYDAYRRPRTLTEALDAVAALPPGARVIAGGTDILPWAREGRAGDVHVPVLVDVSGVAEFRGWTRAGGRVRLGAATVFQDFLTDAGLRRLFPAMPFCAIWFADDQIREQATLAGNLVNASPAADGTPPMLLHGAEVEMARRVDGAVVHRTVRLADFVTGPGRTALRPGELVTAVIADALPGYGGAFEKVGQRRSLVISRICVAAAVRVSADGRRFDDVRLAIGGVGPVPERLGEAEARLAGKPVTAATIAAAASGTAARVASRSKVEYRRAVVEGFVAAAIADALADAGHPLAVGTTGEKADA